MDKSIIYKRIDEHFMAINYLRENLIDGIYEAAQICADALKNGKKVLLCGNGGSAADSQHIAAEFVGRFQIERKAMPAIALTTDTSILSAIANDYGFENVFSRQVEALGVSGDVLIGISTSGNSENVLRAITVAKDMGLKTISLTGKDGGKIALTTDVSLNIADNVTARVQEAHILIGHIICELTDDCRQ